MIVATLLAVLLQSQTDLAAPRFSSYVDGVQWDFVVSPRDVGAAPTWGPDADAPPLPPGAAIASARALLGTLFENSRSWRLERASLHPLREPDLWFYAVEFRRELPSTSLLGSRPGGTMTVVVLMDGAAVTPTRRPWKAPK